MNVRLIATHEAAQWSPGRTYTDDDGKWCRDGLVVTIPNVCLASSNVKCRVGLLTCPKQKDAVHDGDWILTDSDGKQQVVTDDDYQRLYEAAT